MPPARAPQGSSTYDPRWFIWTIVFLIVVGFSLVSYVTITGYNDERMAADYPPVHAVVNR